MNKLNCHLKFEISKYLTCQEYIKLYLVNKSFSEALHKDLDLKIPMFIEGRYFYGSSDDIYSDSFDNLKELMSDLKEKIEDLGVDKNDIKEEIEKLEKCYHCCISVSLKNNRMTRRVLEIKAIPKRYFEENEYDFKIKRYIYEKILKLDRSKSDKLILEDMLELNNLVLNKSYKKHFEIVERDYLKGKIKF